jgi:subtilisin family serine protease
MIEKLLVSVSTPRQRDAVRDAGVEVLAEYPDALLVRAERARLEEAGLPAVPLPDQPVRTASASFAFGDAVSANAVSPIEEDEERVAYHLVQLVGPAKAEWLEAIADAGGRVQGAVPGYRLVVGARPAAARALAGLPFVEAVTPYRPAMKISPRLRPDVEGRELGVDALREVQAAGTGDAVEADGDEQVQVTVFDGEDTGPVAETIAASGGVVLSADSRTVVALAPRRTLLSLAHRQGVEAILPFTFPQTTNDRAAEVMNIPADRAFGDAHLTGAGQVVGVIDSGIDTGDPGTLHPDLRGRVTIVSSPNQLPQLSTDPAPFDDGPADQVGHGTHVAGSVAGDGTAAQTVNSKVVPGGIAPQAHIHFIAVGQKVNWRPEAGAKPPFGLHGLPVGGPSPLLRTAYEAGARIHTNSWGAAVDGVYDARARDVDAFMFTHRDALVLFSAGNSGRDANQDAAIDPDSIGTPGTAKNVLTVGASENDRPPGSQPRPGVDLPWNRLRGFAPFASAKHVSDDPDGMALFSSRGPTDDGRIKPEVTAPGTNVLSVRSQAFDADYIGEPGSEPLWGEVTPQDLLHRLYCWSGGTSMATPLVAGAAALIRQHLTALGHQPSGALLKAFLVSGTVPMKGQYSGEIPEGVNPVSGFGRVDVTRSLRDALFSDDAALAVSSMQTRSFTVVPADPGRPLTITLCWTDRPSPAGA